MSVSNKKVDLCIIGAGSGGLSVAAGASQLGLSVVLIEKGMMGGDCLNTGCVPSKALLAAAKRAQSHRLKNIQGIGADEPSIDFSAVKAHVQAAIDHIAPHDSVERFEGLGVRVIQGHACFMGRDRVEVNGEVIKAKRFVIATGSKARIPDIQGLDPEKVLTHESMFELQAKPHHLIIIGGGPIGVEMAQAHRRLGIPVSLVEQNSLLSLDEPEHAACVRDALSSEGINIYESASIDRVEHGAQPSQDSVSVVIDVDGERRVLTGSHLLIAAGRAPVVDGLGLEAAGVAYTNQGIQIDQHLKTSNKRIFAIGDVAEGPNFTHWAGYQAGVVIKQVCFKLWWAKAQTQALPWVTYTDPELAHVGLTEQQARQKYGEKIKVVRWSMADNDRAVAEGGLAGEVKVMATLKGKILGVSIVGPNAGELIAPWTLMITQGLKISAMAQVISPYPTLGEISKRAAGSWYTPTLFSDKTKRMVRWLSKLPF